MQSEINLKSRQSGDTKTWVRSIASALIYHNTVDVIGCQNPKNIIKMLKEYDVKAYSAPIEGIKGVRLYKEYKDFILKTHQFNL